MHNKAYYQPQMLCIGLHLSGTDPCSYSLYKMEELFSAQYFLFFLVTQWFWTKWSDKHLNFTSQGIFRGPWIIWTLFHNFSIFAIILSISIFFQYPEQFFDLISYLSLWRSTWASSVDGKPWRVYNKNNSWCTSTSSKRAVWNQRTLKHPGCTIKHGLCVLDFSTRHFTKD